MVISISLSYIYIFKENTMFEKRIRNLKKLSRDFTSGPKIYNDLHATLINSFIVQSLALCKMGLLLTILANRKKK